MDNSIEPENEYGIRKCRETPKHYSYNDYSSSESDHESNDSDFLFEDNNEDDDDEYNELKNKKIQHSKNKKNKNKNDIPNNNQRSLRGLFLKKKKNSDSDSDFEEIKIKPKSGTFSSLAERREKRIKKEINYTNSNDENQDDEILDDDDNEQKPSVEKIIGHNDDNNMFFVKFQKSSYADAKWLTREEIEKHPCGNLHLSTFDSLTEQFGLKKSRSIPFLDVPNTEESDNEQMEIEHIVAYNSNDNLYLVKWKGKQYEDVTWEHDIKDENYIKLFNERERYKPNKKNIPNLRPVEKLPIYKNNNELRPYQVEALNWLRYAYHSQKNTILADEMGLGKTVMCIAMIHDIVTRCGVYGPFLIVAPLGTLPNWQREFENWTDIKVINFHGSKVSRNVIKQFEIFYNPPNNNVTKFQVLLTNIETVCQEIELIQSIKWHFVIIDEAHRLKNMQSKIYRIMYSLQMEHILLMTGTPIQNNIDEIFALLHFIEPNQFPSLEQFRAKHANIESANDIAELQKAIKPYMLRRKKSEVDTNIAAKEETIVEVELTRIQKFYYRLLIDKNVKNFLSSQSYNKLRELQNLAMQLRKVCNHPFLLPDVEAEITEPDKDPCDIMIQSSGKLVFIDKLLAKLKQQKTKVLIFSQMVRVLDILEDFLYYRNYQYERLDGRVHGDERQNAIDRFNDPDSDVFVFLLCTKAGGVGLNLTAASTVIIYDCDWNPQNDLQAQDRCHRIGQTHDVQVYRLITRGTYENEMFLRASMKLGLDQAILDSKIENSNNSFTTKEIETLIKKGAYYVFQDDETETDKFVAEDIDQILERRTKKVVQKSVDSNSMFSTATFVVNGEDEKIDINDEHFWERILPKESYQRTNSHNVKTDLETRKSRSSFNLDEEFVDSDDEFGSTWNSIKRDKLLNQMVNIGYERWNDILDEINTTLTINMVQDGCTLFLYLISKDFEDSNFLLNYLIKSDNITLSAKQRRMINVSPFNNKRWRKQLKNNASQYGEKLIKMKAIDNWIKNGCPKLDFEFKGNIFSDYTDEKLLKSIWKHGLGDWFEILQDKEIWDEHEISSKITAKVTRRFNSIIDMIINETDSQPVSDLSSTIKHLKPNEIRQLIRLISEQGLSFKKIREISKIDDADKICPIILNTIKIISSLSPKESLSSIKKSVRRYFDEAEVFVQYLPYQTAIQVKRNVNWLQRFHDYFQKNKLTQKSFKKIQVPSTHPNWWNPQIHDYSLFNHINENGFYGICDFILNELKDNLNSEDIDYINYIKKKKEKNIILRNIDGNFDFLISYDYLIQWIDEVIKQIGGWNTPLYIDIPNENMNSITLPITFGNILIESIGTGKTYLIDNTLYKVGFKVRVHHNDSDYRCSIHKSNVFEIWKSDRAKWTGDTPYDAWIQADPNFDEDSLTAFGLSCPIIQHELNRQLNSQFPDGYEAPNFIYYQTTKPQHHHTSSPNRTPSHPIPTRKKSQIRKRKLSPDDYTTSSDY